MLNNEALKTFLSESDYIILNDKKQPLKAFKDGQNVHKLNEVISESNLGLLLKGQWVVIDVDCKDHPEAAKKMIDIIDRYGWQCNIMKTTRGIHLWFQAPSIKDIKNMVEVITPVGIMVDVKCAERNSYVVIKKDGVMRQWLRFFDMVDYLPLELTPISNKGFKEIDSPINLQKGSRRNNLFSRVYTLIKNRWTKQRIFNLLKVINDVLFIEPLPESEVQNCLSGSNIEMFNDDFKITLEEVSNPVRLKKLVEYLIKKYRITRYSNQLYLYFEDLNYYKRTTDDVIMGIIADIVYGITTHKMKEIYKQIFISNMVPNKEPEKNIIALNNCYFNLNTYRATEANPAIFVINKLDIDYDNRLVDRNKTIEEFMDSITRGHEGIKNLLYEFIGYCLTSEVTYQKALLLYGPSASNGKSTFLELLTIFFGRENTATLSLEDLDKRFTTSTLIDKMINVGADISVDHIKDPSVFKKVVSGDSITSEFKGKDPFDLYNTAKFIFACNKLPSTSENSYGFFRRFLIVPFLAQFSTEKNNIDKKIIEKLTTKTSKNALFKLAVQGLKNLRERGDFLKVPECEKLLKDYEEQNNNVVIFLRESVFHSDEQIAKGENVINKTAKEVYLEYKDTCKNYGFRSTSYSNFKKGVLSYYSYLGLTTRRMKIGDMFEEVFITITKQE